MNSSSGTSAGSTNTQKSFEGRLPSASGSGRRHKGQYKAGSKGSSFFQFLPSVRESGRHGPGLETRPVQGSNPRNVESYAGSYLDLSLTETPTLPTAFARRTPCSPRTSDTVDSSGGKTTSRRVERVGGKDRASVSAGILEDRIRTRLCPALATRRSVRAP